MAASCGTGVEAQRVTTRPLVLPVVDQGDVGAHRRPDDRVQFRQGFADLRHVPEHAGVLVADVVDQVRWFRAQGLVKGDADPMTMIDTRFLPTR